MKRYFYLLFLPALVLLASCHKDEEEEKPTRHYGRTVMVYMAMQNSLGSSNYHKGDSTEIVNGMAFIPENDRLLLFIDDAERPRIYELSKDCAAIDPKTKLPYGPKLLKQWKQEVSSASKATLTEVLQYMRTNYESESYGLVMGSHATGWLPTDMSTSSNNSNRRKTFGIDVGPDGSMRNDKGVAGSVPDQMEIVDVAEAIRASGVHLMYLLFDACLMQNIEVDYALRGVTDYIIASPISISAEGAYYTDLVHYGLFSGDAADVARTYVDYYKGNGTIPYKDGYGTVLSCVRTADLERFALQMHDLLYALAANSRYAVYNGGELDLMATLKRANMSNALNYHPYSSSFYYRPHYYDLVSTFRCLGATDDQLNLLANSLNNIIAYQGATESFWIGPGVYKFQTMPESESEWCGVSMFVPQQIYTDNASKCTFGDLNEDFKATEWYKVVFEGR